MPLILPGNVGSATAATGFDVANSVRYNDGDSPKLNINFGSDGTLNKWTFSMWFKRSTVGTAQRLFCVLDTGMDDYMKFDTADQLEWTFDHEDGSNRGILKTNRKFRDVSAWYHLVCRLDTTDGTAGDRMRMYINGVEETSFETETNPTEDETGDIGRDNNHYIGTSGSSQYFDGYFAEVCMINNQSLAPTSFGEFDSASGIWKPIDVSDLTPGTNGFYLDFEASGNLGNDAFGGTDWGETNLAATDQSTDTCTNNFATLNPLMPLGSNITYSDGNLTITPGTSDYKTTASTIAVSSGKWYAEFKAVSGHNGSTDVSIGIVGADTFLASTGSKAMSAYTNAFSYGSGGLVKQYNNSTIRTDATYTNDNIIGIAVDMDNLKLYWSKDGAFQNSGDPTSGATGTGAVSITAGQPYYICATTISSGGVKVFSANFGSPPYSESGGETDGDGYGNFAHAVPSGYFALNTKNLAEYG